MPSVPSLFHPPILLPIVPHSPPVLNPHFPPFSRLSSSASPPTPTTKLLNLSTPPPIYASPALSALRNLYTTSNASIHPGLCAYTLGRQATDLLHSSRTTLASYLHASTPSNIIFTSSVSSAFILIAQTLASTLRPRDEVILWPLLSDSLLLAWRHVARLHTLNLRVVEPCAPSDMRLRFGDVARLISPRTRVVVLQHTCPLLGTAHGELEEVARFATDIGLTVIVDVTNALRTGAVDVRRLGASAVVIGGGEAIGAPGGGAFVYGGKEVLDQLPPVWGGENAWEEVRIGGKTRRRRGRREGWADVPQRFEVGIGILGAAVAIGTTVAARRDGIGKGGEEWAAKWRVKLKRIEGVTVFGSGEEKLVGMVCFCVEGVASEAVASELTRREVIVDVGYHGARIAHKEYLKSGPSLRVVQRANNQTGEEEVSTRFLQILSDVVAQLRLNSTP